MAEAGPIFPRRVTAEIMEPYDMATQDFAEDGPPRREVEATFLRMVGDFVLVHCSEFPHLFWMTRGDSDFDEEDGFFCWEIQCPRWEKNAAFIDSLRGRVFVKQPL